MERFWSGKISDDDDDDDDSGIIIVIRDWKSQNIDERHISSKRWTIWRGADNICASATSPSTFREFLSAFLSALSRGKMTPNCGGAEGGSLRSAELLPLHFLSRTNRHVLSWERKRNPFWKIKIARHQLAGWKRKIIKIQKTSPMQLSEKKVQREIAGVSTETTPSFDCHQILFLLSSFFFFFSSTVELYNTVYFVRA